MEFTNKNLNLRKKNGRWPVPLVRAAAELGCNHSHLSRVLRGQRVSARLLRAYRELAAAQTTQP